MLQHCPRTKKRFSFSITFRKTTCFYANNKVGFASTNWENRLSLVAKIALDGAKLILRRKIVTFSWRLYLHHPWPTTPPPTSISTQRTTITPTQPSPLTLLPTQLKASLQPSPASCSSLALLLLHPPNNRSTKTGTRSTQNPPKSPFYKTSSLTLAL